MEKINPLNQIGIILYFFDANNRNVGFHNVDITHGIEKLDVKINRGLINEILYKLTIEGYLRIELGDVITPNHTIPDVKYYLLTFEGELLQLSGGYANKVGRALKDEVRKTSNDQLLTNGTWFAGIAAILLLIWSIFVWINPSYANFPYILFGSIRK